MDAAQSLAVLTTLSSEIEQAAIVDQRGAVIATRPGTDGTKLARVASELFDVAPTGDVAVAHVEVGLGAGSVFAVRDGGRIAVATTRPEPASALVLYDLRTSLRRIAPGAAA